MFKVKETECALSKLEEDRTSSLISSDFVRLEGADSHGLLSSTSLPALPIKCANSESVAGAERTVSVAQLSGGMKDLLGRRGSLKMKKRDLLEKNNHLLSQDNRAIAL